MIRFLPLFLALILLVYCFAECVQTRADQVRTLPKWGWLLVVIGIPIVGPLTWLMFGRSTTGRADGPGRPGHPWRTPARPVVRGPEDDPSFLATLERGRVRPGEPPVGGPVSPPTDVVDGMPGPEPDEPPTQRTAGDEP